jgi:hypothetical protein
VVELSRRSMHADPLSRPDVPRASRALPVALAIAGVLAVAAGTYWWSHREAAPVAPVAAERSPAPAAAAPASEPSIRHPIEAAAVDAAPDASLPELDVSDAVLLGRVATALAGTPFERVLVQDRIVRRFVATVDNVPRKTVPLQIRSIQPTGGLLAAERSGGRLALAPANSARYDGLMRVVDGADVRALASVYVRHYPLFQKAYRELGYPDGYFNDRFVAAIDLVLATPDLDGHAGLVQPRVLYEFADPELEALPAGQKALLRLGPANAARVKAKLRDLRGLIAPQASR